jgi:UvrB/UvrC motif-containing protein
MNPQNPERSGRPEKTEGRAPSKDLTPLLKGWDYEPGTINVRKIRGSDGQPKLQMRVELGLLQMELNGRPDGARPHGFDSLLEYFESQLKDHESRNGTELGFQLNGEQCELLRQEAAMYYQRYLSLFVLEDFTGVLRDTARNLRVLDLCGKYAENEQDRLILEQYRPYITMMNTRAAASLHYAEKRYPEALAAIDEGLESIRGFFARFGQEEAFEQSHEVKVLKRFAREIRRKLPVNPKDKLQSQLQRAIKRENYELAAKLRDQIKQMIDSTKT